MGAILAEAAATGIGAKKRKAKRKPSALDNLQEASSIANDSKRLKLLREQLELAVSISSINATQIVESRRAASHIMESAPATVSKMKEIVSDIPGPVPIISEI